MKNQLNLLGARLHATPSRWVQAIADQEHPKTIPVYEKV